MKVNIKKLSKEAVMPKYAKNGDAGLDLVAISKKNLATPNDKQVIYGTGLAVEIPEGYVGLIFPRSSISKTDLSLSNSVGVIDSGYRGEIMFKFNLINDLPIDKVKMYNIGERVGQLIILPYPQIELNEVDELSETERGNGGFGSTGV